MYDHRLFLGLVTEGSFEKWIAKLPKPALANIFINNADHLHKINIEGKDIIGKFLENKNLLQDIYLLESNIQSIIKSKLIKEFDFTKCPLQLFAVSAPF